MFVVKKINVFVIIVILSISILATTIFQRMTIESNNKVVDVVLDYTEMKEMALQSDNELTWWFNGFKDFGVEYVGLNEENLESMIMDNKDLDVYMGWELELQGGKLKENIFSDFEKNADEYPIDKYDVLVFTKSDEVFDFILDGLNSRYDKDKFEILSEGNKHLILLKGTIYDMIYKQNVSFSDVDGKGVAIKQNPYSSKLIKLGLGFDKDKIKEIREGGLKVFARPSNYKLWTSEIYIDALFDDFKKLDIIPPVLIFPGDEILGFPNNSNVREFMQENDIKLGMIETAVQREHIEQKGLNELARDLDYNAVRIFSVWPYIQERFKFYNYEGAEEIENTLYRAVTERNIRLIYFKPFKENKVSYVTEFKEYEKMFSRFEKRIAAHDISIGRSSVMNSNRVRLSKQTLMGWGIVAVAVLLLSSLFKMSSKVKYILLGLGMLFVPGAYFIKPILMAKLMALSASIVFPSFAMAVVCKECKSYFDDEDKSPKLWKTMVTSAIVLVKATAISLLGGLFVGNILSGTEFLLEMDIFRGVKISQMLPIVIYLALYIAYFGYKNKNIERANPSLRLNDLKTLLFEDVKIIYVVFSALILVVGYIYIARTGHETNIQPSNFEMIARNLLEERLLARPRTKEFLLAFPMLMVAVYFARNKYKLFAFSAGLVAVIGQTSVANTFSHLRTPLYLSFTRTVYGLGMGIILGVIYIAIIEIALRIFKSFCTGDMKGRN